MPAPARRFPLGCFDGFSVLLLLLLLPFLGLARADDCGGACTPGKTRCDNGECKVCTACSGNHYLSVLCEGTQDNRCDPCQLCDSGKFIVRECAPSATTDGDRTCQACRECPAGTYESQECGGSSDTGCQTCRTCGAGTYASKQCSGGDTECTACTACRSGHTFASVPCTASWDRACDSCTQCEHGSTYEAAACTPERDTQCQSCTVCPSGKYRTGGCDGRVDTQCAECSACSFGFHSTGQCTADGNTVCEPCCAAGQFLVSGCTAVSPDPACRSCGTCGGGYFETSACSFQGDTRCTSVAGPVVGALAALVLLALGMFLVFRNRRLHHRGALTVRLLEEKEAELDMLASVWRIDWDDLEVTSTLGAGANGVVHAALWHRPGEAGPGLQVAVKTLAHSVGGVGTETLALLSAGEMDVDGDDGSAAFDMAREIDFLQRTLHPNIVRFFGAGQRASGQTFLVLEHVELGDLKTLCRDGLARTVQTYLKRGSFWGGPAD